VEIADYDPLWPETFAGLRNQVAGVLGPLAQRIEHVGSTAIPGLPAKPIIDIDVVIADPAGLPEVITRLATTSTSARPTALSWHATSRSATTCAPTPARPAPTRS
jgi:GrpB-like predicted nucleotidyltransferase (UPF0157 family)